MKKYALLTLVLLAGCVVQKPLPTTPSTPATTPVVTAPSTQASVNPTILFAEDDSNLTSAGKAQLTTAIQILALTNVPILVEGHADETGSREYNLGLGSQRAAAVRDFLVSGGIASTRISIKTLGNEEPAQSCNSASCHAQNRRAVIIAR